MQNLDVISVNLWQMVVSLANLALLYSIVKKFFYAPVKKMLAKRSEAIESSFEKARLAEETAAEDQKKYEEKLRGASEEAKQILEDAVKTATHRKKEILAEADEEAEGVLRRAKEEAALEKENARAEIRREIVELSTTVAEKVLDRETNSSDHEKLVDSFIEQLGEDHETK